MRVTSALPLAAILSFMFWIIPERLEGGDLRDTVKNLYGGDGIRLQFSTAAMFQHSPHFTVASLQGLDALNSQLVSNLGIFPLASTVTGFTFDIERGVPVRTTDSLGPLLSERASTLGAGKLNLAFTYTRLDFRRFNGKRLDSLKLIFNHDESNGDGVIGPTPSFPQGQFELDQIQVNLDLKIKQDLFAFFATYGLTQRWDVGLVIPIVGTRIRADAVASIIRKSVQPPSAQAHNFDPAGESPFSSMGGNKTGVGDIILRTKYNFLRNHETSPDLGILGQIKLPTGDQKNLLGTGETDFLALLIASQSFGPWSETRWLTPHVNLGFEWTTGSSTQSNMRYVLGFDARVHERVTLAVDTLGRWRPNGDGIGDHTLDLAFGAKWNPVRDFILNAGVQIPLNRSEGLRPNVIWTLGLEHTF